MGSQALEGLRVRNVGGRSARALACLSVLVLASCSSKFLKVDDPGALKPDDEFEQAVSIVVPDDPSEDTPGPTGPPAPSESKPTESPKKPSAKSAKKAPVKKPKKGKAGAAVVHEPELEDGGGFIGRRPINDPFWVGETVVHDVNYFKVSAGALTLKVEPYAQVNGRKAYNFVTQIQTYPTFSSLVYAVDDKAVTLVDFEELIPRVFTLHVKETGQRREVRSYFDFDALKARFWEKKVTKKNGAEERKLEWEILPYSQNVFSAIFYMRLFPWEDGKEYAFRVADDEQNLVFTGKAVRREVLETALGPMKAVVVKPQITTKGIFKPVGDIYIWLSDDDRRLVLRIESKIKIGTLVSEVVKIIPGKAP